MALGTPTLDARTGEQPGSPTFFFNLSFLGDNSYTSGGTPNFTDFVRGALNLSPAVEILAVIAGDCGDNVPYYDKANDTLLVRVLSTGAEAAGSADLSGDTFNVVVLAK